MSGLACGRRAALRAIAGLAAPVALGALAPGARALPHDPFGPVDPPQPAPPLALLGDDARSADLRQRLRDKTTAVQLMFTGCSATCPIQGALFADLATRLPSADCRLLSISIDPLGDGPEELRGWIRRFGTAAAWQAAVPRLQDVDRLLDFLRGRSNDAADRHTRQVYLFDRQARLVFRTPELPRTSAVVEWLRAMS